MDPSAAKGGEGVAAKVPCASPGTTRLALRLPRQAGRKPRRRRRWSLATVPAAWYTAGWPSGCLDAGVRGLGGWHPYGARVEFVSVIVRVGSGRRPSPPIAAPARATVDAGGRRSLLPNGDNGR